jgi:hypothetical protein
MGNNEVEVPVMFGEKIVNGKRTGEYSKFRIGDVNKIVTWQLNKKWNFYVPLFITRVGDFIPPLTLDACQDPLEDDGILLLDSINLVNINNIIEIDEFSNAIFEDGSKATLAKKKAGIVEEFINNKRNEELE